MSIFGLEKGGKVRHNGSWFMLAILCLLLFQGWLAKYHASDLAELPTERVETTVFSKDGVGAAGVGATSAPPSNQLWVRTQWMPEAFERKFYQLSVARRGAISNGGNTLIDANVQFNSAKDFLMYLPRALQVGLLSPLPEFWGGKGSTPAMALARKVVGVVTGVFYICLIGLLAGLFFFRRSLGFWIVLVFCLFGILVYAFTYPNVGALMRFRYGFYMPLISFGAAVIAEQIFNWRGRRRPIG